MSFIKTSIAAAALTLAFSSVATAQSVSFGDKFRSIATVTGIADAGRAEHGFIATSGCSGYISRVARTACQAGSEYNAHGNGFNDVHTATEAVQDDRTTEDQYSGEAIGEVLSTAGVGYNGAAFSESTSVCGATVNHSASCDSSGWASSTNGIGSTSNVFLGFGGQRKEVNNGGNGGNSGNGSSRYNLH